MKIALDMQLALGTATGIGEYVRGLEKALRSRGVAVAALQEETLDPWRFDRRVMWDQIVLPVRARASKADILHCASGTMPMWCPIPAVATVHDVAWLKSQRHTRAYARYYFGAFALRRYEGALAIAVDSAFSRAELLSLLSVRPERIHVVYPGVAAEFGSLRRIAAGGFILVPGTVERRKNLEVLVRALPGMQDVRIVSVGPHTTYRADCERLAAKLGVSDRVEFHGYVPRDKLLHLYATCALVAVPSRYEGFGYAAAQALCAGAPLVVSDQASLPEVVDGTAAMASPDDETQWRRAIAAILNDPQSAQSHADAQRARAITRFSWETSASGMLRVYESVLENR